MTNQIKVPNKTSKEILPSSSSQAGNGLESRPFVVQSKSNNSKQPDLNASLIRAEKYGHHLPNISVDSSQISSHQPIQAAKVYKHPRSRTAFGYFNMKGNRNLQGPHRTAHITTSTALDEASQRGRNLDEVLGSKIVPRPRVANRLLRQTLKHRGPNWKQITRKQRTAYLKQYKKHYNTATSSTSKEKKNKAIHSLIELSPSGTYGLESGTVTSQQIAGKGERRTQSLKDLPLLSQMPKGGSIPPQVKTVDASGTSTGLALRAGHDRARQLGQYAMTKDQLSDAESYGSESDSDIDL